MKFVPIYFLFIFILPVSVFSQWVNTNSPNFSETAFSGTNIFGVDIVSGVYKSTNNGINWAQTSLNISGLNKIAAEGTTIFAGTQQQEVRGVYRSTNSGLNWSLVLAPTELYAMTFITINGNNIYTSTGRNLYRSTDNGSTWLHTSTDFFLYSVAVSGDKLFAGVEATGIYLSTNNGLNWSQTSLNNRNVLTVKANANYIFAGTDAGVFVSTNTGTTWAETPLNNRYVSSLTINAGNIFAGTDEGVYISKDNGAAWKQKNEGLSGDILDGPHLAASNNFIFASGVSTSTWKREISEIINIHQVGQSIPSEFKLSQNFPNPFNPSTKINFSLPRTSRVTLTIFDAAGKTTEQLVNQILSGGTYEFLFNASYLPSGVYFYRLQTESFRETKSMVLLK